tara:strand:+ start:1249 stop:1488 length:240 start_codon:yes stop_codon:yes gene_type:complete
MSVYDYIDVLTQLCKKHEKMSTKDYQFFMTFHFGFYEFDKRPLSDCIDKINTMYKNGLFDRDITERPLFLDKPTTALES